MFSGIDGFFYVLFLAGGAIIGSFLNVCIVRMPRNESVVFPSSHCPRCQVAIRWFDNIPLVSFLVLRARCRACRQPIPWRYFLVELVMAGFSLWTYICFGLSWALVPALAFVAALLVASLVDIEWRIIPDEISVGGMWAGLVLSFVFPALHKGPAAGVLLTGASVAFILAAVCLALYFFRILRYKLALGDWDRNVLLLGVLFLVGQWAAYTLAPFLPLCQAGLFALADALQGAVTGACALWFTGLVGEIFISKRIVTEYDFKGVVDDPEGLLKSLARDGYVDAQGNLQPAFRAVKSAAGLSLPAGCEAKRAEIFEIIQSVDEGGVMGWGDIKLMAMAGAFLGWQMAGLAFFIAPFFGAAYGLVKIIRRQDTAIPYGPFLAIAFIACLYWGDLLLRRIMVLYGL